MAHLPPRTLVKSKEALQVLSKDRHELGKYQLLDLCLGHIWSILNQQAFGSKKTQQIINIYSLMRGSLNDATYNTCVENGFFTTTFRLELTEVLKKEYPGCEIDYAETKGYDGKILEQVFIIDWS